MKHYLVCLLALLVALAAQGVAAAEPAASPAAPMIQFVDPMAGPAVGPGIVDMSPLGMYEAADGVVKNVIRLLLLASVLTWTIALAKWIELRTERRKLRSAMDALRGHQWIGDVGDTGYSPLADMISNAEDEIAASKSGGKAMPAQGVKDRIALRLDRLEAAMRRRAGRSIGVLAMVSSTGPFIGLAGTVWGIMDSFIGIAHSHTTNLAVVAPGIAEALLTTAVGLVAAIPAALLYNFFSRALAGYAGEVGDAGAAVLCMAAREVDLAETGG